MMGGKAPWFVKSNTNNVQCIVCVSSGVSQMHNLCLGHVDMQLVLATLPSLIGLTLWPPRTYWRIILMYHLRIECLLLLFIDLILSTLPCISLQSGKWTTMGLIREVMWLCRQGGALPRMCTRKRNHLTWSYQVEVHAQLTYLMKKVKKYHTLAPEVNNFAHPRN